MKVQLPFALQEGEHGFEQNSREQLINMYAEVVPSGKGQIVRRQRPGLSQVYAISGEKRCIERFGALHYAVIGQLLYSFDGTTPTVLGALNTSSGRCSMIFNDIGEILVSDGAFGYYWNGSTLARLTPPSGMDGIGTLGYLGGFGIISVPGSDRFYVTPNSDFSQVEELSYATAESAPDKIVRAFVDHNELWLAGERSTEVWQLTGGDFPFQPLTNAILERGCAAAFSYAAEDNTVFFLGDDRIVYRADGYRPVVISTAAINDRIAEVPDTVVAKAYAFTFTARGAKFYALTFPGYLTLLYNIASNLWSSAQSYGEAEWQASASNGHHVDYVLTPGGICSLVDGLSTDEGGVMLRKAVSAPGDALGERMAVNSFRLRAEVGRAAISTDADVMLRFAPDGEAFGNVKVRSLGPTGDYRRKAMWRNLGTGHSPVVEVSVSDPVEVKIIDAIADVTAVS